jgi:N-acetylmuramate 1-kinase
VSRETEIARFLAQHGFAAAHAAPLAQDASLRRYLRLTGGPRPAVLMDAPPPESVRPFLQIAAHLTGLGVSVPEIIAADEHTGLVLEEDLGDALYPMILGSNDVAQDTPADHEMEQPGGGLQAEPSSVGPFAWSPARIATGEALRAPPTAGTLFSAAVDLLVTLHRAPPPPDLPAWGAGTMRDTTLGTLFDWWWPAMHGTHAPQAARNDFATALTELLAPLAAGPGSFVHRDFFAGNLLWLPERVGIRRVGLIDFQGASIGQPAYDLVSLLQDARRAISVEIAAGALDRYLQARPELDPTAFRTAFAACAAQRHLRVACQWVRLACRDGRPAYLAYGPHTWALLNAALTHPVAAPLARVMDRWIPPDRRSNPPDLVQ